MHSIFLKIYTLPIGYTFLGLLLMLAVWTCLQRWYETLGLGWKALCKLLVSATLLLWTFAILYQTVLSRTSGELIVHRDFFHQLKEYLFNNGDKELLRTLWMNVLLFVPGGLLLEALWPRCCPRWVCIPLSLILLTALSLGIEAVQYRYALGVVEADDVLCNGLGAALGLFIHEGAVQISKRI